MKFTDAAKEKLQNIIYMCIENKLVIDYVPASNGLMIMSEDYKVIASMWIDSDDQLKELERIQKQVFYFIKEGVNNETDKTTESKVS